MTASVIVPSIPRAHDKMEDSSTPATTPRGGGTSDECVPSSPSSDLSSLASSVILSPLSIGQPRSPLLSTPPEIIHRVLCDSGVDDLTALARAAKTCRELRSFIYDNPDQALWRDIHLQMFDDPKIAGAFPVSSTPVGSGQKKIRDGCGLGTVDGDGDGDGDGIWRDGGNDRHGGGQGRFEKKEIDYKRQVQDREFVQRIFRDWPEERFEELGDHLETIVATLMSLYLDLPASPMTDTSPPPPPTTTTTNSTTSTSTSTTSSYSPASSSSSRSARSLARSNTRNGPILESIIRSEAFKHIYYNLSTKETKPLLRPLRGQPGNPNRRAHREVVHPDLSRLHLLLPPDFCHEDVSHRQHRGYLREVVYNQSNFQPRNDWGPFTPDGKVDWTLLDAIGSVMMANAKDVLAMGEESWRQAVLPLSYGLEPVRGWGFNDLRRPADLPADQVWDWAGVAGPWCGSYAFLDYSDWIALNEPRLVQFRRSMNQLDLARYAEAVGDLMRLVLIVDHDPQPEPESESTSSHHTEDHLPRVTTTLPTSSLLPPIFFRGSSVQQHGGVTYPSQSPASFVRGVVRLTADDPPQVRWTLVIRYGGQDRWRLEGVQVGGRGSKRGFFGIWTDALKEEHSPNGPVWYWKP
ncbi:hypothetical protein BCR39DRAFT_520922 [Naematelia encephala]|uniref:F-box domain-containing protein n=1 Tax=Naematelia encephala TaxID=71784 RepID=A0A1Y2BDZ3_9TREE|nr:hypothetical protein BCR39DRAFT_520922 [Naematelia encephala]